MNIKKLVSEVVAHALSERKNQDPTKEEMIEYLRSQFGNEEGFKYDAEAAIYWFSNHYHGGQGSNLYSALSTSQYSPGAISRGPEPESMEEMMYQSLEQEFGNGDDQEVDEGFDPQSMGPNTQLPPGSEGNPYEAWNKEMRQLENTSKKSIDESDINDVRPKPYANIPKEPEEAPNRYTNINNNMAHMEEGIFDYKHKQEIVIQKAHNGITVTPFNPIGDVAGGGLLHFSYGDQDYSKAIQMANHLKRKYPKYKIVDLIGTEVNQLVDPDAGESAQWDKETAGQLSESLELTRMGKKDMWGRPMYMGNNGKIYNDINLGKGNLEIHDTTEYGEPSTPIRNYKIVNTSSEYSHAPEMRVRSDEPQNNLNEDTKCQKCKGEGHYTHKFGMDNYQNVVCDFPGCHNGIVNHEENFRQWGIPDKNVTDYKSTCAYLLRHGVKQENLPSNEEAMKFITNNHSSWWGVVGGWLNANGWQKNKSETVVNENDQTAIPNLIDGQSNNVAAQRVNKILSVLSKGLFSDQSWKAINNIFSKLKELGLDVVVSNAKYGGHADTDTGMPKYKEWQFSIPFTNKNGKPTELVGVVTAHGAGTVEQPLSRYDITAYVSAIPARQLK